jgi:hypothetical protein
MNDQKFELEQNLPTRAKEIIERRRFQITDARRRLELLAGRYEQDKLARPSFVPLDLVTQTRQNETDAVSVLDSVSSNEQPKAEPAQTTNGDLDLDEIRRQVEAA